MEFYECHAKLNACWKVWNDWTVFVISGKVKYTLLNLIKFISLFHVKILLCKWLMFEFKTITETFCVYFDCFTFQFIPNRISLTFQVLNNAFNWKLATKVNSISYWSSYAQMNMSVFLFIVFWMETLLHISSFHVTYQLRWLAAISFRIADCNNQSLISRAWSQQKTKP